MSTGLPQEYKLKLRAEDGEDLLVFGSFLQQAMAPVSDFGFFKDDQKFVVVFNRLRWEKCFSADGVSFPDERVKTAVNFFDVTAVQYQNFDPKDNSQLLEFLTFGQDEAGKHLVLLFAGDCAIRLEIGKMNVLLHDFGASWKI